MFNKCSPRSIFCCLFTVCTNDTHILSRNCPPDVHPRTNFRVSSAFPFAFVSSTEFFQFFFFFFSFFVVLSRGHTRIERTIVHLFFSSPSPHFNNESSKRLERGQETCFFKFGIILISPRYFEGDGEFLRRAKTREKLARSNLSHLLILQEPCSPKILGIKNLAEHNRSF